LPDVLPCSTVEFGKGSVVNGGVVEDSDEATEACNCRPEMLNHIWPGRLDLHQIQGKSDVETWFLLFLLKIEEEWNLLEQLEAKGVFE
jgi:hypothetical protein